MESKGVWTIGQVTLSGEGSVTKVKVIDNTGYFRELVNKIIDEREEIKRLQEEVDDLNRRIFTKSVMCNPNKYKSNNGENK